MQPQSVELAGDDFCERMLHMIAQDDQLLVEQPTSEAKAGLGALEDLYDAHHRVAFGLAMRMLGNRADAEDVVQDAFLRLWRARSTYDPGAGSGRVWLLGMVRNRAIDVLRARKRRPAHVLGDAMQVADGFDVAVGAAQSADREHILHVVSKLSDAQREVLELAYFGGLTHTEIAGLRQLPLGTVKGRIRLAIDRLRAELSAS